jgi:hypothetical protein
MATLGPLFVSELLNGIQEAFDRSDYIDWSEVWRRKYKAKEKEYLALLARLKGGKGPVSR